MKPTLGDSHNFGRRVSARGGRIAKPRTVLWEWLVLCADSPLRQLLRDAAERDGLGRDAFEFLPSLRFFFSPPDAAGEVERIELSPLGPPSSEERRSLAIVTGRSLALFSWLGITDLHWENLVLGVDARGQTVFAPLDVEMILADMALPTETKLLPEADPEYAALYRHACGIRRVLPTLGKPVQAGDLLAMAGAYRRTLRFLDRRAGEIASVFSALSGLREAPIRVCLRGTGDYVRAAGGGGAPPEPPWPPLLDEEAEQLARGDIPYFFRLYGEQGIHYYADPELATVRTIPSEGDVPRLEPLLSLSRGLRSPSRKKLREEGLFTLLGAFDHPSLTGVHANDELEVTFRGRTLLVKLGSGEELESRRDMSDFVGSVYLPCRCGEVLTVFVPPVTTCEPEAGARRRVQRSARRSNLPRP